MNDLSNLRPGDSHYKAFVGPPLKYDIIAAMQFNLMTAVGLRAHHKLLDIGCGSLRAGRLFIPYLDKRNYFGIEPNKWLIKEGIKNEIGRSLLRIKKPHFNYNSEFQLNVFNVQFDFIISQSIFSHASAKQIEICLKNSKQILKEGGVFMSTFVLSENDNYSGEKWVYPGCVKYTHEFICQLIHNCELKCIKTEWLHPNGQNWYMIFHESNEETANRLNDNLFVFNRVK